MKIRKPLIGITSSYEKSVKDLKTHQITLPSDYVKSVLDAGGIPVVLPTHENLELIEEQIKGLDGLLLSGGIDIDPVFYGEDCLQNMGEVSIERDKFEFALLEEFLKTKKPILAICRGFQLVNVFYGGTLYQDTKYVNTNIQHSQTLSPELPVHNIKFEEKNNVIYEILKKNPRVNSFHHQMVKDLGENLTVIAQSNDGIVEAFQNKNYPYFYAVQWHPEKMAARGNEDMKKIFDTFIEACNI